MTEEEVKNALQQIVNDIQKVSELCNTISTAAQNMNKELTDKCYPVVNEIGNNWSAGPAVRYVQKVGGLLGELQDDAVSIAAAAGLVQKQYIESCRERVKALGVDPHTVLPNLY